MRTHIPYTNTHTHNHTGLNKGQCNEHVKCYSEIISIKSISLLSV